MQIDTESVLKAADKLIAEHPREKEILKNNIFVVRSLRDKGLTYGEIRELTNLSLTTIKRYLGKAEKNLVAHYQKILED